MCCFLSCKQKTLEISNGNTFDVQKNISYGKLPQEKLDLYVPQNQNAENTVFIMIHGGGWKGGEKEDFNIFMIDLMKEFPAHIFVNMNYQLAGYGQYAIPAQTGDILQVMDFVNATTNRSNKFILVGASSGAHIAMMYGYHFNKNKNVRAVINIVGPADLNDNGFQKYPDYKFVERFLISSSSIPENVKAIEFGSPVHWISTAVPTISFYGKNDDVVPFSQKIILDDAFKKTNIYNESYEFQGNHLAFQEPKNQEIIIGKIRQFIEKIH